MTTRTEIIAMQKITARFAEIYQYRTVLFSLVHKRLFGNYKNSILGFGWHFVTPILTMLIYYIVFNGLRPSAIDNFWVFLASALFPYSFLVSSLTEGVTCVSSNSSLIKKISFPREILVLSYAISSLIVRLIGYFAILAIILISGFPVYQSIVIMPLAWALTFIFSLGLDLLTSSINVYVRDLQYFLSTITVFFIFTTPVFFEYADLPYLLNCIVSANPFTYYIELFHHCVYYGTYPAFELILVCTALSLSVFIVGLAVFYRLEKKFADKM